MDSAKDKKKVRSVDRVNKFVNKVNDDKLKKKVDNIENSSTKRDRKVKEKKRKKIVVLLIVIASLIIISTVFVNVFLDTESMKVEREYTKNIALLKKQLKKVVKSNTSDRESLHINSTIKIIEDTRDNFEFEIEDVLSEYKNEYTRNTIGIVNERLVYMGDDYNLMKIAASKGIECDYSTLGYILSDDTTYYEVNEETGTLEKYLGYRTMVVVPSILNGIKINEIGNYAFESSNLSVVVIPDSITKIGDRAFADNDIFYLKLPENIESIGRYAFFQNRISDIALSEKVKKVDEFAFACNEIERLQINSNDTKIGGGCFNQNKVKGESAYVYNYLDGQLYSVASYAGNDKNINIKDGIVKIENYAFYRFNLGSHVKQEINSVTLPNSLKLIGNYAFSNNNITNINIPNSVIYIGKSAFKNNKISNLNIQNMDSMFLGIECFNDNELSDEQSYIITNNPVIDSSFDMDYDDGKILNNISEFDTSNKRTLVSYGGKNRSKLLIPYSIQTISDYALSDLGINEIVISGSVEEIGNMAFARNNISYIELPESVNKVGYNAFANNNISTIKVKGKESIPEDFDQTFKYITENIVFE